MLEIKNLSKSFHENKVLDHINLKIEKGDVVGIIGPSGTGKSTLLRCINQLEIPEEGEAVFGGKTVDLSKKHKDSLEFRKITGMVFQRFYLFEKKTALENVREGLMVVQKKSKADAKAIALKELERVGMASWANHYPKHLSGGQQQRVAIARALALKPELLLLHEADFSLRPGAYYGGDTGNIFAVLDGELEGDPVIFCAHMDVVEPWSGKKSVLEKDGTIHSAGDTVLGADDISGILEILYCVQLVLDSGKPHKKIEILFTIGEELYVKGSDVFDYSKVTVKQAYVLDLSEETTFNIGTIQGGTATNIVPDCCVLTAYETPLESKSVTDFQKACEILGFSGELTGTFGGSDNNSFAKNGIEGLVLSNGMYNAHSTREYTTVDDLYKGAELIGQLILL